MMFRERLIDVESQHETPRRPRAVRWALLNWPLVTCIALAWCIVYVVCAAMAAPAVSQPLRLAPSTAQEMESLREIARRAGRTCMHATQAGLDRRDAVIGEHVVTQFEVRDVPGAAEAYVQLPSGERMHLRVEVLLVDARHSVLLRGDDAFCAQRMLLLNG